MASAQATSSKPRISAELKEHIVELDRTSKFKVDDLLNARYSRSTHFRAKRTVLKGGSLKHRNSTGRPSKLQSEHQTWILKLIRHRPNIQLKEIRRMLAEYAELELDETTISRWLKKTGITRKKLSARARRRDPLRRIAYRLTMAQFRPEQLVFAEETHTNRRTAWRSHGWAPSHERAVMFQDLERGIKYTLLPGMTLDGIIAPLVVPGAVTQEIFDYWVEKFLLPKMQPWPRRNSVLILDNCSVHKSARLVELLEAKRCVLVFLPAYSPDFNPIELAFGTLKAAIRRDEDPSQWSILRTAQSIRGAYAPAFFRSCGYGSPN